MGPALNGWRRPLDPGFWRGRRVFLTGHTGFIGGWAAVTLDRLGAAPRGFALAPTTCPSFCALTRLADRLPGTLGDIRDARALSDAFRSARPDVVLHLAAQAHQY